MKLFLIGGMEDLNFNYCYKIIYESGETYDRRRNELSVEISEYSCAMKSHFRKFGNQMSGSGNHLCNYASLLA